MLHLQSCCWAVGPGRLQCSPRRSPGRAWTEERGTEGRPEREGFAAGRSLTAPTVAEQCSHPSGSSGSPCWVGLGASRRSPVGGSPAPGAAWGGSQGSPEPRSSSSAFSPPARETACALEQEKLSGSRVAEPCWLEASSPSALWPTVVPVTPLGATQGWERGFCMCLTGGHTGTTCCACPAPSPPTCEMAPSVCVSPTMLLAAQQVQALASGPHR